MIVLLLLLLLLLLIFYTAISPARMEYILVYLCLQVDKFIRDGHDSVAASRQLEVHRSREMRGQYELSLGEAA